MLGREFWEIEISNFFQTMSFLLKKILNICSWEIIDLLKQIFPNWHQLIFCTIREAIHFVQRLSASKFWRSGFMNVFDKYFLWYTYLVFEVPQYAVLKLKKKCDVFWKTVCWKRLRYTENEYYLPEFCRPFPCGFYNQI